MTETVNLMNRSSERLGQAVRIMRQAKRDRRYKEMRSSGWSYELLQALLLVPISIGCIAF